jgi:hypothetical protein
MIEVNQEYISEAIGNLFELVGVKENICYNSVYKPFNKGKIKECIKLIADYLGLPIEINVTYVPSTYTPTYSDSQRFSSQSLVVTDGSKKGGAGISAEVYIPSNLPLYGSSSLTNFPINVKISENINEYPDTFMSIMAHELSHIVLYSLQHSKKENEVYTDITAMLLGFNEIMSDGRKITKQYKQHSLLSTTTTTETVTYGYLTDSNFKFAQRKIREILRQNKKAKNEFIRQSDFLHKQLGVIKRNLMEFKKYMEFLDASHKKDIEQQDAREIVSFHQLGYFEEIEKFLTRLEKELTKKQNHKTTTHYLFSMFDNFNKDLATIGSESKQKKESLEKDLKVLKRNVNFFTRFRINLK